MLIDYHHHSNHSFDSKTSMSDICEQAIKIGLNEICFTDHYSVNPFTVTYGHMKFDRYLAEIESCRAAYEGRLSIKSGLELCEPHEQKEIYRLVLQELNLDFVLGSVHNIGNEKVREILQRFGPSMHHLYFEEVYKLVCEADIDCIAHLDLIKKYAFQTFGMYAFKDYQEIIREILQKAIDRNIAIEINTSGLKNKMNVTMPSKEILQTYRELGGELLTVGSDSHHAETVGQYIKEGYELAKGCGFTHLYRYEARKPIAVAI
ncbi:MAG: histidinol-phosphatase HisJ family protein [Bacillus sp. (in: firmicutes)]